MSQLWYESTLIWVIRPTSSTSNKLDDNNTNASSDAFDANDAFAFGPVTSQSKIEIFYNNNYCYLDINIWKNKLSDIQMSNLNIFNWINYYYKTKPSPWILSHVDMGQGLIHLRNTI